MPTVYREEDVLSVEELPGLEPGQSGLENHGSIRLSYSPERMVLCMGIEPMLPG